MRAPVVLVLCLAAFGCGAEAPPDPSPTCTDQLKNGAETDVDCGGATCGKCALGQRCGGEADCVAGATCESGLCTAKPSCTDHLKNAAETDVDCGGGTCGPCADGQGCAADTDCADGLSCQTNHLCAPKLLSCGESLDCTQACGTGSTRAACVQDCLDRTSPEGQQKLLTFTQCLDGACPTRNAGPCDQAAPGFSQAACTSCIDTALDVDGACIDPLLACYDM